MKLRQKLAVILASAMVVTAVPVVTMASTTNKIVKSVSVIKKDDKTTGVVLKMKFEQEPEAVEEFYLDLTNANWLKGNQDEDNGKDFKLLSGVFSKVDGNDWIFETKGKNKNPITVTYRRQGDTTVRVNVQGAVEDDTIQLPLPIKATGGAASVAVTGQGSSSIVTEGNYSFLSTGEKAATLTIGNPKAFYDNGELAAITLKETFINSFAASGKDMIVKIKLEDTDFEFEPTSTVTIKGSYGFDFAKTSDSSKVKFAVDADDKSTAYVWISKSVAADAKSLGRIEIAGIGVDSDEKDLTLGDLTAGITTVTSVAAKHTVNGVNGLGGKDADGKETAGAELDKDYSDVVLAKIANYGAYIQMKDEKAVDVVAGRDKEVVFEVKESVDDVFVGSRTITLGLKDNEDKTDKQFFMISKEQKETPMKFIDDDSRKIVEKVEFVWKNEDDFKKENKYSEKGMYRATEVKITLKGEDKDGKKLNNNKELDKFKVKTKIYIPVDQQEKKSVEITAQVRGVDEFKSATAVNVVDPFDLTFEQTTLKVGLQNQAAGNITLTEKDKEMLMKGKVTFNVVKGSKITDGIVIEEKGKLTVTGDLKRTDFDADGSQANKVTLKRQSKAASSLAIDDMEITVDRTVPEGYYDLELSGDAIDEYDGKYKVEKYIVIGTPNTQDISSANGLAKGTAKFAIGESKYTLNGVEATMDAASYIQDPGYTMVPVRYVAEAFGVAQSDILFGNGAVTIIAGNRTVQLINGSNIAVVNGASVAMSTKVVIKDNRTYAPIGEIAKILGIASNWDNTTKTATFTN